MEEEKVIQEQEVIEPQQEQIQEPVKEAPKPAGIDPQESFRLLREKAERAERERDELAARMREYDRRMNPVQEEEDLSINLGDDDLPEGKHIKKMQKYTQREIAKQKKELDELKNQTVNLFTETRLKSEFPDLDSVVSADNLKQLAQQYPEVAAVISSSNDYYSKAKSAYTMIKKLGIGTEDQYLQDKALAAKNAAKPINSAAISAQKGDSPITMAHMFANGLTAEVKAKLRAEVKAAIKKGQRGGI